MSRMLRTNDCVPAGTFVQLIAGEVPSPGAAPGAAWLNFTGISPPSGNAAMVIVMAGPPGAPLRWPRSCAATGSDISATTIETTNHCRHRILLPPRVHGRAMVAQRSSVVPGRRLVRGASILGGLRDGNAAEAGGGPDRTV